MNVPPLTSLGRSCFEEKDDVKPIPHWQSQGDVSGHKICGDCAKALKKNECPFCHEVSLKEELMVTIADFVKVVKTRASHSDPNQLAALLEQWQFFEMEYSANPTVIHRVAALVVEDKDFHPILVNGVAQKQGWMRDAAGIIVR